MNKRAKAEIERKRPIYYINDEIASPEYALYLMYVTYKSHPKSRPRYDKTWPLDDLEIIKKRLFDEEERQNRKKKYNAYMRSDEWKQKRNEIISIYKQCVCCGSEENLNVHHLTYENIGNEKYEDLLLLCNMCHKNVHRGKIKVFCMTDEQIEAFNKVRDIIIESFKNDFYGYVIIKR